MSSFRKIQTLSRDERWLLVQALLFLPLTALAVHTVGVARWQRTLARLSSLKKASASDRNDAKVKPTEQPVVVKDGQAAIQAARAIAKMVRVAAQRGVYQPNCLQQSLVLWWMLRRNSVESEIRFGARKDESQLQAHAWVECCGVPLNEAADVYERFSSFEVAGVTAAVRTKYL